MPHFFIDCLKDIWVLPMLIDVGELWRCLVRFDVTSLIYIQLLLSLSIFAVANHFCMTACSEVAQMFLQQE